MRSLLPIVGLISAVSANALVVSPQALQEALGSAAVDVEIAVDDLESIPDNEQFATYRANAHLTQVYRVSEQLSRELRANTPITIRGPGGELGGTGVMISGYPRPQKGSRYRAHLNPNDDGTFSIAGFDSGLIPKSARAFSRNRTDGSNGSGSGAFLYWETDFFPIPFHISASSFAGHPEFVSGVMASFQTWRNEKDTRVEFTPMGCTTATRNENDGVNAIIFVKSQWLFDPAAIAITRNFYVAGDTPRSGLILDSDILFNGVNHSFTVTNESGKHDIQNIVTHEAGHFLGFGHEVSPADADSTMFAVASPNETKKRQLHASDLAGLQAAYGGLGEKNGMQGVVCEIPPGTSSCLAVHGRTAATQDSVIPLLLILSLWIFGRRRRA